MALPKGSKPDILTPGDTVDAKMLNARSLRTSSGKVHPVHQNSAHPAFPTGKGPAFGVQGKRFMKKVK